MATTEFFKNGETYSSELEMVYNFHEKVFNTIVNYLKEHGDIVIPKDEKRDWRFCFLDMEGTYHVKAIRLDENKRDFYLETISDSGDKYNIDWITINHDMVIEEMLMGLVFPEDDTENEPKEQAEKMVNDMLKADPYPYARHCDAVNDYEITDVNEGEDVTAQPKERKPFDDVVKGLDYFEVNNSSSKTSRVVAEKIRDHIRSMGWDCLEEYETEAEWLEKHPEANKDDCEEFSVVDLEFVCKDDSTYETLPYEFHISFYGDWGNYGAFEVYAD